MCLQWGRINESSEFISNSGISGTLNFPITFSQSCYTAVATCKEAGDIVQITAISRNNFSFRIYDRLLDTRYFKQFYWFAVGI